MVPSQADRRMEELNKSKQAAALALAAVLVLTGSAQALFGKKDTVEEGAPTVRELEIRTYRGIPYRARFLAQGGEELTFSLAQAPRKGTVVIEGDAFTYAPDEGLTGNDHFTYTATDAQGRTSRPAAVSVRIEKTRSGVSYEDMAGNDAAFAAQDLAEAGIFTGDRIGGKYRFEPERPVSRQEFLAMAMETLGIPASAVTMTGFCDDEAIPTWAKAYAASGVSAGLVRGKATPQGAAFLGEAPITFNQAAAILDRGLDLNDVDLDVWYGDREMASSWAAQAVGNLEAARVLSVGSFGSMTMERPLTRADAALILSAARSVLADGESARLFS